MPILRENEKAFINSEAISHVARVFLYCRRELQLNFSLSSNWFLDTDTVTVRD